MIYVILYYMISEKGELISGLFHNAFTDSLRAEKEFNELILTKQYPRKELWVIIPGGRRQMIKEVRFNT